MLDLDLLDPEEKEALSLGSSSSIVPIEKSISKSFSSIIPLLPPRQVELDAIRLDNKLWDFELTNHKAPFSISSLALICSLTPELIDQCKTYAIQARHILQSDFFFELPLIKFSDIDPSKCGSSSLIARTKGPINPDKSKEPKKFLKNCWNTFCPFLKCQCKRSNPNSSCNASIIWLDHLLLFIFQNLPRFFHFNSGPAQVYAFIGWVAKLPLEICTALIVYSSFHDHMLEAAKGLVSYSPNSPFLPKIAGTPLVNTIDSILKPLKNRDSYSKSPFTPGSMASSSKKPILFCGSEDLGDTPKSLDFTNDDTQVQTILTKSNNRLILHSERKNSNRFIRVLFVNKAFDFISPKEVFTEILNKFQINKSFDYFKIAFGWKYSKNLAYYLYKPLETFCNFDDLHKDCICSTLKRFKPFLKDFNDLGMHVLTLDTNLFHNKNLKEFSSKGLNHIPILPLNPDPILKELNNVWIKIASIMHFNV